MARLLPHSPPQCKTRRHHSDALEICPPKVDFGRLAPHSRAGEGIAMEKKTPSDGGDRRKARLAEQLRANLQKRKAQARSRRAGDEDRRAEGLPAAKAVKE